MQTVVDKAWVNKAGHYLFHGLLEGHYIFLKGYRKEICHTEYPNHSAEKNHTKKISLHICPMMWQLDSNVRKKQHEQ